MDIYLSPTSAPHFTPHKISIVIARIRTKVTKLDPKSANFMITTGYVEGAGKSAL
jgi:ABC-type Zn2+ transport system substrate-binding protein/surface adhesin